MKRGPEYHFSNSGFPLEEDFPAKLRGLICESTSQEDVSTGITAPKEVLEEGLLESMLCLPGVIEAGTSARCRALTIGLDEDPGSLRQQFVRERPTLFCDSSADTNFLSLVTPSPGSTSSENHNMGIPDLSSPHSPSLGSDPPTPTTAAKPISPSILNQPASGFEDTQSSIHANLVAKAPSVTMPFRTFSSYVSRAAHNPEALIGKKASTYMSQQQLDTVLRHPPTVSDPLPNPAAVVRGDSCSELIRFFPSPKFVPQMTQRMNHSSSRLANSSDRCIQQLPQASTSGQRWLNLQHMLQESSDGTQERCTTMPIILGEGEVPGPSEGMLQRSNGCRQWQSLMQMISLEKDVGKGSSRRANGGLVSPVPVRPGTYIIEVPTKVRQAVRDDGQQLVFARTGPGDAGSSGRQDVTGMQGRQAHELVEERFIEPRQITSWPRTQVKDPTNILLDMEGNPSDELNLLEMLGEDVESDWMELHLGTSATNASDLNGFNNIDTPPMQARGLPEDRTGRPAQAASSPVVREEAARVGLPTIDPHAATATVSHTENALALDRVTYTKVEKEEPNKRTAKRKRGSMTCCSPPPAGGNGHEECRKHRLSLFSIDLIVRGVLPSDEAIEPEVTAMLAAAGKAFIIEVIQTGRHLMEEEGTWRQLYPRHVREAARQLKEGSSWANFSPYIFR